VDTTLEELINDLEAEQAALQVVLDALPAAAWDTPTHAPGWAVRDQVSHLAYFDEAATLAIADPAAFADDLRSLTGPADLEARYLPKGRSLSPPQLASWWRTASRGLIAAARTLRPGGRIAWFGPDMSPASFLTARLMETWSHGLDIVDVTGAHRPDTDRLRHVAFLGFRTRNYSYMANGLPPPSTPVRVELTSPSGQTWVFGDPGATDTVRGTATDFCRVVTRRRHLADTGLEVHGAAAREWMLIAQAFAGPPGPGRRPGEFAHERQL